MAAERRAWWRRAGVGVMHGALWGFGFLPSRHRPLRSKEIRTLVFLHGWGSNRSAFYPLQAYLAFCGYRRQLSINYPSRTSIEAIALGVKREIDRQVRGGRIDLICHSMGGLVARFYVQFLGGERRVDRLITLATPHQGTYLSAYLPSPLVAQLRPESALLRRLEAHPWPTQVEAHCLAAERDLVVLPSTSALLPFGQCTLFDELGHGDILFSPRVFRKIQNTLDAPRPQRAILPEGASKP